MRSEPITDPRTGERTTTSDLARAVGLPTHVIWQRWEVWGVRGISLLAPQGTELDLDAERREAWAHFLRSPVGILTTHRLGHYRRAREQRQHQKTRRAA